MNILISLALTSWTAISMIYKSDVNLIFRQKQKGKSKTRHPPTIW